jgi:oligosaccharyltransferase complex subunit delta (ribophorin II)
LSKPIQLGSSDTLKILLTAKEDKKSKRPHQAFLLVEDLASGLDTSFPLAVKENGKGKVEIVCCRLVHGEKY